jgi:serine/threonine protein kinase
VARRLPSQPPVLAGYSYLRALGMGGFADVFLYEQALPRGEVAVKVLLPGLANNEVREMFLSEANLMSQLKTHPAVVTVHTASIAPDGRPYLVMEYCPWSYGTRYKTERISVAEVLRTGIKIGSALESAHRLGFLHRDIKPSNILLTQYNHPVLADFGIAATLAESESDEAEGMSIPWSAPEVLQGQTRGTIRSELWSLAATLFTLLAGHTPFEYQGKSNTRADIQRRIVGRESVPPTGRPDVPRTLEDILGEALNKNANHRPDSILAFIRGLQLIESELGLPQTPVEVSNDTALATARRAGSTVTGPTLKEGVSVRKPGEGRVRHRGRTERPSGDVTDSSVTVIRNAGANGFGRASGDARSKPRGRALLLAIVGSAVAVVAAVAVAAFVILGTTASGIPVVSNIRGAVTGDSAVFSWDDPGLAAGDLYSIRSNDGTTSTQAVPEFTLQNVESGTACITVRVSRSGKSGDPSSEKCVDLSGSGTP